MRIFDLAQVQDKGIYYEVEEVVENRYQKFSGSQHYLGLNNLTAMNIREAFEKNKIVRINKEFQGREVMPCDLIIIEQGEMEELEYLKNLYIQKARTSTNFEQAVTSGIHLYDYININNILNSKGFFIHDDNREEEYLKILETGDEKLIDMLEIYLNAKDIVSRSSFVEHLYLNLYSDIKESESENDVLLLFNQFMEKVKPQYKIK